MKHLIPDGFTFTILRDPVETFESFFSYMNIDQKVGVDINKFAWEYATQDGNMALDVTRGRNRQLFDLGLDVNKMEKEDEVKAKIEDLDKEFDQVLILEHLEESLVIMADRLCWPLEQVCNVRLNSRTKEFVSKISMESRDILTDWLWAEYFLYNHFLQKHKLSVSKFGAQKTIQEVGRLRSINLDLTEQCAEKAADGIENAEKVFKPLNKKIKPVVPQGSKKWCRPFFKTEISYTKVLRKLNRALVSSRVESS